MKKLLVLTVLAAAVAAAPSMAQVAAQTRINMNMPGLVILYHRNTVTFDVQPGTLASLVNAVADEGTASVTDLSGDAGVVGNGFDAVEGQTATLLNFWAVRSIGANDTQVTVTISNDTLNHAGAGQIVISAPRTRSSGGVFGSNVVSFPPTGFGPGSAQLGDVRFDVDLSGATDAGAYTGAEVTVEAVNL